jgi:hypothetical protein
MPSHSDIAWAALAVAALGACTERPRTPGPAELALVTQQLDRQLNAPAASLQRNMKEADRDKRVYVEELTVAPDNVVIPVDWWVYRQGWIKLAGVDSYYRGYFSLTPPAEAFIAGPSPRWLVSRFKSPPQVSCTSGGSFTGCQVSGVAGVSQAPEAAGLFKFKGMPDAPLQAELDYTPQGWQVAELKVGGQPVGPAARIAMFGDWPEIYKARDRFALQADRDLRRLHKG